MIGVIANRADHNVVREFFELFKTPWEFYRRDAKYDVVLCAGNGLFADGESAKLVLFYAGTKLDIDDEEGIEVQHQNSERTILSGFQGRIPIYGQSVSLTARGTSILTNEKSQECTVCLIREDGRSLARLGYDLFAEIRTLLTTGQPPEYASIPTLELHIALLRNLIIRCGIPLIEIPPVPDGYQFVACLTHDVDHPSIRQHKWDHTIFGFLYRATVGSLAKFVRRRVSARNLLTNLVSALKLPFVHLGVARDMWADFPDLYLEFEEPFRSTFFIIPFRGYAGKTLTGPAPAVRGSRYAAKDIVGTVGKLLKAGCEIGLHGIDAWLESSRGSQELEEIRRLTGNAQIGVRMHWLYYNQQSPEVIERAGAAYDSTIGYNETVGYRAGTTQVYKPLEARHLLELPLHIMDTALFYPAHLNLTPILARPLIGQLVDNAVRFGGCLTINWHDRSAAPERLWGACYGDLIQDLKCRGAWFATAREAVAWFRKRRCAVFEPDPRESGAVRPRLAVARDDDLPRLRLRHNAARELSEFGAYSSRDYVDLSLDETTDVPISWYAQKRMIESHR